MKIGYDVFKLNYIALCTCIISLSLSYEFLVRWNILSLINVLVLSHYCLIMMDTQKNLGKKVKKLLKKIVSFFTTLKFLIIDKTFNISRKKLGLAINTWHELIICYLFNKVWSIITLCLSSRIITISWISCCTSKFTLLIML